MSEAPKYFDCSGFIKYVFGHFGIEISRSTLLQATYDGKQVKKMEPGDILFYRSIRGHYNPQIPTGIGHAAIYLGDGKAIHANTTIIKDYPQFVMKDGKVKIQSLKDIEIKEKEGPIVMIKRFI